MPRYEITSPDGAKYEIEAPDNANEQQVLDYARQNFGKQQTAAPSAPAVPPPPPTTSQKFQASIPGRLLQGVTDTPFGAAIRSQSIALPQHRICWRAFAESGKRAGF